MNDPKARGGVRRYLDKVEPEEYLPDLGEVDITELSFTALCDLYGSDKGTIKHNYSIIYERIFGRLIAASSHNRKECVLHIAEAGVACGASLRAMSAYLPSSIIYGYDIRPECAHLCSDAKNIYIIVKDPSTMTPDPNVVDMFIDDASHISEDIVHNFRNCWRWVKPGGYYVIEDLRCTYSPAYTREFNETFGKSALNDRQAIMAMIDELMRTVDAKGEVAEFNYYPQLLVVRKASESTIVG
jgi:hypothetical protein